MNTQINEDYVSFETAKLLKEKGFNESTCGYYHDDYIETLLVSSPSNHNGSINAISAPSLGHAMKWLREVHNLHIEISPFKSYPLDKMTYFYKICHTDQWNDILGDFNQCGNFNFPTYEEAAEAAIKYCLTNLI